LRRAVIDADTKSDAAHLIDAMPAEDSFAKGHIRGAVNFAFPKEVMDAFRYPPVSPLDSDGTSWHHGDSLGQPFESCVEDSMGEINQEHE